MDPFVCCLFRLEEERKNKMKRFLAISLLHSIQYISFMFLTPYCSKTNTHLVANSF